MKNTIAEGGCACGAIRYRVSGPPSNTMICHCQTCRRVAASPVVAWLTFPIAQFDGLDGHDLAGLFIGAGVPPGKFALQIDDVRFR